MSTLPGTDPNPQALAVEIVASTLDVLKTRDGLDVSDALIDERARNTVAALLGAFHIVPRRLESVEAFKAAVRDFKTAAEALGTALRAEAAR